MKVWVYQRSQTGIVEMLGEELKGETVRILLGTLDLPIEPIKKMVKKEIILGENMTGLSAVYNNFGSYSVLNAEIPVNAQDIKITYEVEE